MALIIGPITDIESVQHVIVRAFQAMNRALLPEHVRVVSVHHPQDLDAPLWRWALQGDATQSHPEFRRGIALDDPELGWVVAATDSEDETATELAEQALCHLACISGE